MKTAFLIIPGALKVSTKFTRQEILANVTLFYCERLESFLSEFCVVLT